ncbi:MAG: ATP-binding protein [Planctomycetota bacterium]
MVERSIRKKAPLLRAATDGKATTTLIKAFRDLSLAPDLEQIMAVVKNTARELVEADGATFVLREGDLCYYADESAIGPLWKGHKFPMTSCISGWVMIHRQQAVIPDIYEDPRIPIDAYSPTFVKSLTMTPIRLADPLGSIGTYWSMPHQSDDTECELLQTLAEATAIAVQSLETRKTLQQKVIDLDTAHNNLSRLTWFASHDLKEPLRGIQLQLDLLQRELPQPIPESATILLRGMRDTAQYSRQLLEDLLDISHVEGKAHTPRTFPVMEVIHHTVKLLQSLIIESEATIHHDVLPTIYADPVEVGRIFQNLLANSLKYRHPDRRPEIRISCANLEKDWQFSIEDNGVGIPRERWHKIFEYFSPIPSSHFPLGRGLGLAICRKVVQNHGGKIWIQSSSDKGTHVSFTLRKVREES